MPTGVLLVVSGVSQLLLAIWGAIVTLHEDWAKGHRVLVLSVFVVLGGAGLLATIQQAVKSSQTESDLASSLKNLDRTTAESLRVQTLNTELQRQLIASSNTITELTAKAINSTIGGDSFCHLEFAADSLSDEGGRAVVIGQHGEYPLYELEARITDLDKLEKIPKDKTPSIDVVMSTGPIIQVGELAKGLAFVWRKELIPFSNPSYQRFNVFFQARNGRWVEKLRLRKVDGKWLQAYRVFHDEKGKRNVKILSFSDKGFPVNSVKW